MTIATRLRRALCRHDWLTLMDWPRHGDLAVDCKCRKCGKLWKAKSS